jgi:hypothetical protein
MNSKKSFEFQMGRILSAMKKLSGADKRLLGAVLTVILLVVGLSPNGPSESCEELCEYIKFNVTFIDQYAPQSFIFIPIPNILVVIIDMDEPFSASTQKFPMRNGKQKVVELYGGSSYLYTVFALKYELSKLSMDDVSNLSMVEIVTKAATPSSVIKTGVVSGDSTIVIAGGES